MTPEQLLQPRYKVRAPYFFSPYKVGDIITVQEGLSVHLTTTTYRNEFGEQAEQENFCDPKVLQDYPHLFRPMEWWEDRKAEDMPRFLKSKLHGYVNKVVKYRFDDDSPFADTTDGQPGLLVMELMNALPATEEEYNNYINSKQ